MSAWSITVQLIITVVSAVAMVLIFLRLNLCLQSRRTRSVHRRHKVHLMVDTRLDSALVVEAYPEKSPSASGSATIAGNVGAKDKVQATRLANVQKTPSKNSSVSRKAEVTDKGNAEAEPKVSSSRVKIDSVGNTAARSKKNMVEGGKRNGSAGGSNANSARPEMVPVEPDDDYSDVPDGPDDQVMDTVVTSELVDEDDTASGHGVDEMIQVEVR